jgi:hypothetical protein
MIRLDWYFLKIAFEGNGQRHTERRLLDLIGFKSRWRLLKLGALKSSSCGPHSSFLFP